MPSKEASDEVTSRPSGLGTRCSSNPKERTGHLHSRANKRFSLPVTGKYKPLHQLHQVMRSFCVFSISELVIGFHFFQTQDSCIIV
jgi:hypothetical protein